MMKLAVLFDHFGPYHLARLRGVSGFGEVLGVEFYGCSHDYAWEVADRAGGMLTTLSAGGRGSRLTTQQIREKLETVFKDFRPDAVAVPGWSSRGALAALQWCLKHRVPAVLMTESSQHDEQRMAWKEWTKRRLLRLFPAALAGGSLHAAYLEQLGMSPERVFLGYDVIDNEFFHQRAAEIRVSIPPTDRRPHFLASARFIEKKNLFRLLRAYADYRIEIVNRGGLAWPLVLLGDGELRPRLEALVDELGLRDAVTLPGFKQYEELPGYYARASAFIHASTTEQWGLVVNEAMASGLPVLVSDRCGCASDLVKDGANGFVFDPFDQTSMTRAMIRLSGLAGSEQARMGRASSDMIAQWGPERFGEGLSRAADRALSDTRPSASPLDAALLSLLARK